MSRSDLTFKPGNKQRSLQRTPTAITLSAVFTWPGPGASQGWEMCWDMSLWLLGWAGGTQRGIQGLDGAVAAKSAAHNGHRIHLSSAKHIL